MSRAPIRPVRSGLLVLLAVLLAGALPAPSQARCGQRDEVVRRLEHRHGETRRSAALQDGRGVLELFANAETGSWTILLTTPSGLSCLMAAGESGAPPPAGPEEPA